MLISFPSVGSPQSFPPTCTVLRIHLEFTVPQFKTSLFTSSWFNLILNTRRKYSYFGFIMPFTSLASPQNAQKKHMNMDLQQKKIWKSKQNTRLFGTQRYVCVLKQVITLCCLINRGQGRGGICKN